MTQDVWRMAYGVWRNYKDGPLRAALLAEQAAHAAERVMRGRGAGLGCQAIVAYLKLQIVRLWHGRFATSPERDVKLLDQIEFERERGDRRHGA